MSFVHPQQRGLVFVGALGLVGGLGLVGALGLACERRKPPPLPERAPPPVHSQTVAAGSTGIPAMSAAPTAAPSFLVRQRETELRIPQRQTSPQRIAFSRRRLAILGDHRLVVWSLKDFSVVATIPVEAPLGIVAMADGAFLVATKTTTLRLESHQVDPGHYPSLILLPGSRLWPDRRYPLTLWVHTGNTLLQYQLPDGDEMPRTLIPVAQHPLPNCDEHGFVGLKDGSFLFTAGDHLHRFFPGGRSVTGPAPKARPQVWRLSTTHRIDRAWVVRQDGSLQLIELAARFKTIRSFGPQPSVFDVATNDDFIGAVLVEQVPGAHRQWSVTVRDNQAQEVFKASLPPEPRPEGDDWVARAIENRGIELAPHRPLVAVGGPSQISVWNPRTGQVLLDSESFRRALESSKDDSPK